jgi:hypothetical protein
MDDFDRGYHDGYQQGKTDRATDELIKTLFGFLFKCLYYAFIFLPLIICALWITNKLKTAYGGKTIIGVMIFLICLYGLLCLIYFLKGIAIALMVNSNKAWMVIWVICVFITCGLQVLFIKFQLEEWLKPFHGKPVPNDQWWSWLGGLLTGILVYNHYKFKTDIAPKTFFWAYRRGFLTGLFFVKHPIDNTPDEADQWL